MAQYQSADSAAAGALIRALSPQLYRFFLQRTSNREDAADLLQDTWLRIHKARHTYRRGDPLLPWVFAIARHAQVDNFRRQQRVRSREMAVDTLPETPHFERSGSGELPSFDAIIRTLPASQREVLTMLKVAGMSLEEVARATGSSVGSVKQKAHRAYGNLRRILESRSSGASGETT